MALPPLPTPARRVAVPGAALAMTIILVGLAGPVGTAQTLEGKFRAVTEAGAGPAALHGSQLAWLGPDGILHLSDLANGTVRALTALPAGARMQSLAFDGTWVAWCDNRFGDLEAFAMDVRQLSLVRLSRSPAKDSDITVGGGHAAWLHDDALVGTDLAAPAMRDLSGLPGISFTPVLDGDLLVWSQILGQGRHLVGLRWGGNATVLTTDPLSIDAEPTVSGGRIAWRAEVYNAQPGTPGSRSLGMQIRVADVPSTLAPLTPHNITTLGGHEKPALGDSWLAWLEKDRGGSTGGVAAVNLADGNLFQVLTRLKEVLASDAYLVLLPSDGTALQAHAWAGSKSTASPALVVAAAVLLGSVWAARRRWS